MEDVLERYELTGEAKSTDSARIRPGRCRRDGKRVMIKVPRSEYPTSAELALIRHEHALLTSLEEAPVARALDLVRVGNGVGLVLEDVGRVSFDRILAEGPVELGRWLDLAIGAARALKAIHARGVLHKDVKPHHFFVTESGVRVIDFGIASVISHEEHGPVGLDHLEGTLAYISPEQTGRMNRSVDRRSDLYSLGATLYELLTGALPFPATDPLELVHCHIARYPAPPLSLRPGVPPALSEIVLRLLQKVAEDRYQTAAGLETDLLRCRDQLAASGRIESFALGRGDLQDELVIPQKLYGRADAVASLVAAFERAREGRVELCLISGGSGIGKSALVHELYKQLGRGGRFVAGKFDQFNRSVPYSAVAQACRELMRAQLAASADVLATWSERLRDAVGGNGQLVVDVVPEVELLLGKQPAVAPLGPSESLNRFERTFQRFVAACASLAAPLVLFLDDLQWADAASLRLLRLTLTDAEQRHLLVIGSYRDSEITGAHPLTHFMQDTSQRMPLQRMSLGPLGEAHVRELLLDTLHGEPAQLAALARLLVAKTGGNPFFIGQFLHELHRHGLLRVNAEHRAWTWDLGAIEAAQVTDNVVDLVIQKLSRLEPRTQAILKLAACVGHRFDSRQLGTISQFGPTEVAQCLWQSLEQGFVVPLDKSYRLLSHQDPSADGGLRVTYRFTHDRVQQAAYAMIPDGERGPLHLRIGRQLLARSTEDVALDEALFEIAGHLNLGRAHLTDAGERLRLVELDLRAAERAKNAAAAATALELTQIALELLGPSSWSEHYERAYAANMLLAECAYVSGNLPVALAAIETVEAHARSSGERLPARNLHALLLTDAGRLPEASAKSLEAIRWLGVEMPEVTDKAAIGAAIGGEFGAYQAALAGREIQSLADIPAMTDPEKLALVQTFARAIPAAFQWNPELMVLLVLKAVQLPLRHGTAPLSSFFYAQYGIVHAVVTQDYATSHRFGELAIQLSQRPEHAPARGAVHFLFAMFNSPWHRPLAESIPHYQAGARAGFEVGDRIHATYCLGGGAAYRFYTGEALEAIAADIPGHVAVAESFQDVINHGFLKATSQTIACLQGKTKTFGRLDDDTFTEAEFEAAASPPVSALYGANKAMVRFLAGFAAEALQVTETFQPLPLVFYNADYELYHALALAELACGAEPPERERLIERLKADVETHARWAQACPHNFTHRHDLVCAELAALEGRAEAAMDHYERAIQQAAAEGFVQHVALANELCGRFHHAARRKKVARSYLTEARYHYERWGAHGKAAQLARAYPDIDLAPPVRPALQPSTLHAQTLQSVTALTATALGGPSNLDLMSAMRAARAVASELELDRLMERLLTILIENAGARRGFLILPEGKELSISATITVDPDRVVLGMKEPLSECRSLPVSIPNYVARSKQSVVLDDAARDTRFARDPYLDAHPTKSIVCLPLLHQGELSAVLYLENAAAPGVFHAARVERLEFLATHAAVALENAKLYSQVQAARQNLQQANDTLEQKVRERTTALSRRNADMRRVLDTVTQGLITVDLEGKIASECSLAAERWFGPFAPNAEFAAHMERFDQRFGEWFLVTFQTLLDGVLGVGVAIEQLPKRLAHAAREYTVAYCPIYSGDELSGLLVAITDETEALAFAREEAAQKEQLALCKHLARQRAAVVGFFDESREMLAALAKPETERSHLQRLLHTLKGNASMFGLGVLAARCHAAEDALSGSWGLEAALEAVRERWQSLADTLELLLGQNGRDRLEVTRADVKRLVERLQQGTPASELVAELRAWQLEPAGRALQHLGEHARNLGERLGKAGVDVIIDDGGVRTDVEKSQPLWSALVHLVRNAADHGFESAEERAGCGKPERNELRLQATLAGDRVQIRIRDDGRGIDWAHVRSLAESRGLPHASTRDLTRALLSPEISTRGQVSATSGRGVGMFAVDRDVGALGGTLSVESEHGKGCCWIVDLPSASLGAIVFEPDSRRRPRASERPKHAASA